MPSTLRLLAIGDCNSSGKTPDTNVPKALVKRLAADGINCSLDNLGDAMNSSREGLAKARAHSAPADILLLSFGLVDAWITTIPMFYISYYPDNKLKRRTRKILKSLKKRLRHPLFKHWIPTGPVVRKKEFQQNIEQTIEVLRQRNPQLKVVLWGAAPTDDSKRNLLLDEYNDILKTIAKADNCLYLDTTQSIVSSPRDEMFDDAVHLSKPACQHVAHALEPLIKQQINHTPS